MLSIRVETRTFCRRSERLFVLSNVMGGDWRGLVEVTECSSIRSSQASWSSRVIRA